MMSTIKIRRTELTEDCNKNSNKKEDPSRKSREAEEQEEFFDLVGKHVYPRPTPQDVRSIIERIRAKSKAS
jgi:hypothetical protein